MVEFSVVPVPANPNALITGRSFEKVTGKSIADVQREFHEFVEKSYVDKIKSIDDNELKSYIETLDKLLAVLKANAQTAQASDNPSEKKIIRLTIRKTATEISQGSQNIIKLVKKGN
jgi:ribosomal protein L29